MQVSFMERTKQHRTVSGAAILVSGEHIKLSVLNQSILHLVQKELLPDDVDRECVHEIIFSELVEGIFARESRQYISNLIELLQERGCDGVVLGCTEIQLIIGQENSVFPVFDSTRILAPGTLREAQSYIKLG